MADKQKNKAKKKKRQKQIKLIHIDQAIIHQIAEDLKSYNQVMCHDEMRKAKDKFMDLYQKCEYAYKQILIDYKIKVDGYECITGYNPKKGEKKFNPDNLKVVKGQYQKILFYGGIPLDERLFSLEDEYIQKGNKSCRRLRNEITHSSSKNAIREVFYRHTELYRVMNDFLKCFK